MSWNYTTGIVYSNYTASSTDYQVSNDTTITDTAGNVINFTVVVNDTSTVTAGGNLNQTSQILRVGAFKSTSL